jgi:hypothetical protein
MSQNNIWGDILQSIAPNQSVRDYQHASRTFIDGLYRLSPKLNNLFHVFIDINENVGYNDPSNPNAIYEIGLLAKTVQLPKFTVQTKTHNAYNRKTIQQEKITYDPVTFTFHDDSTDVIRRFWYNYYSYYYRDSDYLEGNYKDDSKYKQRQQKDWGYTPKTDLAGNIPFITTIRIYSLHQKRFSAYYLIRPMIQIFQHGQHAAGEYAPIEHSMTVNYESVLYDTGPVSNGTVLGFGELHYDHTSSPLRNLGALIGAGGSILNSIENGDLGGTVQNVINATNILNGTDTQLKQTPSLDLSSIGESIMKSRNPLSSIFVPTSGSIQSGASKAVPAIDRLFSGVSGRIDL